MIGFKISYEAQFNEKLDISHLREWKYVVYIYDYTSNKKKF